MSRAPLLMGVGECSHLQPTAVSQNLPNKAALPSGVLDAASLYLVLTVTLVQSLSDHDHDRAQTPHLGRMQQVDGRGLSRITHASAAQVSVRMHGAGMKR